MERDHQEDDWMTDIPLSLVYATDECHHEKDTETPHTHSFTELFFITSGSGSMQLEDQSIELKPYDMLLVSSQIKHAESFVPVDGEICCYSMGISGLVLTDREGAKEGYLGAYTYRHNFADEKETLLPMFEMIVRESKERQPYHGAITRSLLQLLICNILRITGDETIAVADDFHNKQLSYIKNYIEMHYQEHMTLDELAEMARLNKYYLVNEFKRSYGYTPIDYLLHRRVEESKQHLIDGKLSMKQIATSCGFHSQSYFNQVFKKKTDLTPSAFRREYYQRVLAHS